MKQKILLVLIAISFLVINSCNEDIVGPQPGRRDYVWTVDTLSYPGSNQIIMQAIWGSSSQNIYVAGHNESGGGKIYHYDGINWSPVELPSISSPTFYAILGLDRNNIYIAGSADYLVMKDNMMKLVDSSVVIHYDGSSWKVSLLNKGRALFALAGTENNIYAAGLYKTFFEYSETAWQKKELKLDIPTTFDVHYTSSIIMNDKKTLLMLYYCASSNEGKEVYYFLKYENGETVKIDSFDSNTDEIKWGTKLWQSPLGIIYSVNPGAYKLNENEWEKIAPDYNFYSAINGTNDNNIFLAGDKVFHYNGKDWYEFSNISLSSYGFARAIYCFGNEVFIVFSDGNKSFILKGVLQNK